MTVVDSSSDVLSIEVGAAEMLSYAMAHNGIDPLYDLIIESRADHTMRGVEIAISVDDPMGTVGTAEPIEVDVAAGERVRISSPGVMLDAHAMLQIHDRRTGTLRVTASHEGRVHGRAEQSVVLLPGDQWLLAPPRLSLELLPSFVMPHDPGVAAVLDEAAQLLKERTGSASLEGYSGGPERVDATVDAIWSVLAARGIRYVLPPASWGEIGQRVRTPAEVIEAGRGTCLDTTVAFAAVLEHAGIRPLLWLLPGHAFVGYWRGELALPAVVVEDFHDLVNLLEVGAMRCLETTLLTRNPPGGMADAERAAFDQLREIDETHGIVDVWMARLSRIYPLPARRRQGDTVQVINYQPAAAASVPVRPDHEAESTPRPHAADPTPPRVARWKNHLLDLSFRNRLINFTPGAGLGLIVPEHSLDHLEDLINAGRPVALLPNDQLDDIDRVRGITSARQLPNEHTEKLLRDKRCVFTDVSSSQYVTRLRGLARKARTIVEETGANTLYLALGSLVWHHEGRELRSPLVLVSVQLVAHRGGHSYELVLDEAGGSTPNFCLLERLRVSFGLEIPGLADPELDDSGINLDAAFTAVRHALAEAGYPFRVEETADIALLQFARFRLWKDLNDHWESFLRNPLVKHLAETPEDAFIQPDIPTDPDLDALDAACPLPTDASQLEAVAAAVSGQTFVLEGPPGTGKSQTITNLITRAIADGKRILFVAEKRAALDVVATRLDDVGMAPFCLDLHDKESRPTAVKEQIVRAIDLAIAADREGSETVAARVSEERSRLARYAQRLHEHNAAGLSLYSAHTRQLALGDGPTVTIPAQGLGSAHDAPVQRAFDDLPDRVELARPSPDHPWVFVRRTSLPADVEAVAFRARDEINAALDYLDNNPDARAVVDAAACIEDISHAADVIAVPFSVELLEVVREPEWAAAAAELRGALAAFTDGPHPVFDVLLPTALDLPVDEIFAQAQAAEDAGIFRRGGRRKEVAARLAGDMQLGVVLKPADVLKVATDLVAERDAAARVSECAQSVPGVTPRGGWNPYDAEDVADLVRQCDELEAAAQSLDSLPADPHVAAAVRALKKRTSSTADAEVVRALADGLERLVTVSNAQGLRLKTPDGQRFLDWWQRTRPARDGYAGEQLLRRWVALHETLEPLRERGFMEMVAMILGGDLPPEQARLAFQRGLADTSVKERLDETGLARFDAEAHGRASLRFAQLMRELRGIHVGTIPADVVEARPFDPQRTTGRFGQLQRELKKQRRAMGVRQLMEHYGDIVTAIMPCVLVSPASVARFFRPDMEPFDIVVFDEASQIRVADAIGAMGRARSVVIVGDSKQMPPTSFGEAGGLDDAETPIDVEVVDDEESILKEAVQARVPQRWLTWHYRSRHEALIAFSNAHYYENRLSSFPAPSIPGQRTPGLRLVTVDGHFQRDRSQPGLRTNPIEARALVDEIRRRFDASPTQSPSIGVVTFNAQQRDLIDNLIRDAGDARMVAALDESDGLFVKNLENVQGDERDTIFFSTAFAANDKGVLPLNFGPLTRAGGERRLNVAITRARREVVVFTSFSPNDLRVEQTQSLGIRHLRDYMEMALLGTDFCGNVRPAAIVDRHRDDIAERLRDAGLSVDTDVGLSDFRVDLVLASADMPDRQCVAVLLDGPGWNARRTVGDRDGLPVVVLGQLMEWPAVERVWLPEWLANADAVVRRLVECTEATARRVASGQLPPAPVVREETAPEAIAPEPTAPSDDSRDVPVAEAPPREIAAREAGSIREPVSGEAPTVPPVPPAEPAVAASPPPAFSFPNRVVSDRDSVTRRPSLFGAGEERPGPDPSEPASGSGKAVETGGATYTLLPHEARFIPWKADVHGSMDVLDSLPSASSVPWKLKEALEKAIWAEGPIHRMRLARLVAACFGLTRVRESRAQTILRFVPTQLVDPQEPFVWPPDLDRATWRGFRTGDGRKIDEISLVELSNAMASLSGVSAGISEDELLRETLRMFNVLRLTEKARSYAQRALEVGASRGIMVQGSDGLWREVTGRG